MIQSIKDLFTKRLSLKIISLMLALLVWFYIVNELNKGSNEEIELLKKMRPGHGMIAKKLEIRPMFVGRPAWGSSILRSQIVVTPEYCVVMGPKDALSDIKFVYTTPIDLKRTNKTFTTQVSLSPIAPGVYTEETLVQVTVPIGKEKEQVKQ